MSKKLKKTMAAVLAGALVFSMLPAAGPKTAEAAEPPKPTAHYDMSHSENQLTDVSGNNRHATLHDTADGDFKAGEGVNILQFANKQYADLPQGLVTDTDNDFTVEITLSAPTQGNYWAWVLGQGVGIWGSHNIGDYIFMGPKSGQGGYEGKILSGIKVGDEAAGGEIRMPASSESLSAGYETVTLVSDGNTITVYLNGEQVSQGTHSYSIETVIPDSGTIGYIGKSLYEPDALMTASVGDIKFYDAALTQEQVAASMPTEADKQAMFEAETGTGTSDGDNEGELIASYDMSHDGDVLKDVSGNGNDAKLVDTADADFLSNGEENIWRLDDKGYAQLPISIRGDLGDSENFTVQATLTTQTSKAHWLFALGSGFGTWNEKNVGNYIFVNPSASDKSGNFLAAIKTGTGGAWKETRLPDSNSGMADVNGYGTVTMTGRGGMLSLYLDGQLVSYVSQDKTIQDVVPANGDIFGYIGMSLYNEDPLLTANLADFKIYSYALREDEIKAGLPNADTKSKLLMTDIEETVKGENESLDTVTEDLDLADRIDNVEINWGDWAETDVVAEDGTVTAVPDKETKVTIPFSYVIDGTTYNNEVTVNVLPLDVDAELEEALASIDIPNKDDVRGNITLPETSENGIAITWTTDRDDIVNVNKIEQADYDAVPAGTVTRPANDTVVTMTASLTLNGVTVTKNIPIRVKAAPEEIDESEYTDYFFTYFAGEGYSDGEQIYFASSQDGLNWTDLNDNKPILTSSLGEKGVRDPFIIRSFEGDKFYMIATDLKINGGNGWTAAQEAGSQALMVWESTDLVNWSEQRMVEVSADIDAGCTWAPEATYDVETGEYVVYWASKVGTDGYAKQRLYYAKTRDFYTFTEPKVFIDTQQSSIDTTILYEDGVYYRYTKNEGGSTNEFGAPSKTIYAQKSDQLLGGTWDNITTDSLKKEAHVEGPTIFKLNEDDQTATQKYCLLVDNFGNIGYYPLVTDDLSDGEFSKPNTSYKMPSRARHGTPIRITAAEYARVMQQYGGKTVDNSELQAAVDDAEAAGYKEADYTAESWTTFSDAFAYANEILEKGTAATAAEVSAAIQQLDGARQGLVPANRETLVNLVADANAKLNETDKYTGTSLANLKTYIDAADAVLKNSASTPAQIQTAIDELNQAIAALDEIEQGGQTGDGGETGDGDQTGDGSQTGDKGDGGKGDVSDPDKAPQTGDNTNIVGPVVGVVIALLLAAAIVIIRKKRK